jgi:molybdopterin molybdotransferase
MLSVEQAEQIICNLIKPFDSKTSSEILDLRIAAGRILAEDITSHLDFPHWDNSAMDGYAVRYADTCSCSTESPVMLEVVEEIPAGAPPQKTIAAGQAARILTGSMMPRGADTVVMQEETRRDGNSVAILAPPPKAGAFVRSQGAYYRAGTPLLNAGTLLNAPEIAVLAAAQVAWVKVLRQPRVAIVSTGDELAEVDHPLQPGQIVDSNHYALATLLTQMGANPLTLGIVPDDPEALQQKIGEAIATADIVLSSGGVSVGDYDYVERVLTSLGGKIHIRSVAMKPGKPLTFATFERQESDVPEATPNHSPVIYFGLPGNPASALVTFWRFVQPALRQLSGLPSAHCKPMVITAASPVELHSDGKRETYVWGKLVLKQGRFEFEPGGGRQVSGDLVNLAGTNALAILPMGTTRITPGDPVTVLQVGSLLIH